MSIPSVTVITDGRADARIVEVGSEGTGKTHRLVPVGTERVC